MRMTVAELRYPVLDRTKPERLFQTGRGTRAGNAAVCRRIQLGGRTLSLDVIQSLFDRRILACLRKLRDLSGDWIQINIKNIDKLVYSS
jgi:hypothetical protein